MIVDQIVKWIREEEEQRFHDRSSKLGSEERGNGEIEIWKCDVSVFFNRLIGPV